MQTIYANIDKQHIEKMPTILFDGRIFTITTVSEAQKAVKYLMRFPMLGIDTETRPNFQKGQHYQVSLLQISTHDTCFLFRLNRIGIPDCLKQLLSSREQIKIGLSMKDDIRVLCQRRSMKFGKYIELQQMVRKIGIQDMSLQKVFANLFSQKISKNKRLTNWEATTLTEAQKRYAATDAWACLKIYERVDELYKSREYKYIAPMDDQRIFDLWFDCVLQELKSAAK